MHKVKHIFQKDHNLFANGCLFILYSENSRQSYSFSCSKQFFVRKKKKGGGEEGWKHIESQSWYTAIDLWFHICVLLFSLANGCKLEKILCYFYRYLVTVSWAQHYFKTKWELSTWKVFSQAFIVGRVKHME